MSRLSRRKLLTAGLATAAGTSGLVVASRQGLIPPDAMGPYGLGNTLNYATHRLLVGDSLAREFRRDQISTPFANGKGPDQEDFRRQKDGGFLNWTLAIDGMVARPGSCSLPALRAMPSVSQITQLTCEEGWSFVAEWTGVPFRLVLELAGVRPGARHVAYFSMEKGWWDSLDLDEALHPQTLVCHTMNGADLPIGHGGPLRLRVPRQLGYKSVKHIARITVTDDIRKIENGLGASGPQFGYTWFAGI